MTDVTTIENGQGVRFRVTLVKNGERYGLNGAVVHDKPDPLVEFYDLTSSKEPGGQFVSRYYLSTLLGTDEWSKRSKVPYPCEIGINLNGGVPRWQVSAGNVRQVLIALLSIARF